jgi:hypothetical protein
MKTWTRAGTLLAAASAAVLVTACGSSGGGSTSGSTKECVSRPTDSGYAVM